MQAESRIRQRATGCLWSIFIGDALSMPVHWFYNRNHIKNMFGYINSYEACPSTHPTSILNLSSTGTGGRGNQQGNIVGDVILKGKKHLWGQPNTHYHHGMKAGENTLNSLCARLLMRYLAANNGQYDAESFLKDYVEFMTTEGSHNDTYAETYHRMFFQNYHKGKPLLECGANDGHNTASIGGFVTLPVVIIRSLHETREEMRKKVIAHLNLTHPDESLSLCAVIYADLLYDILLNDEFDARQGIVKAMIQLKVGYLKNENDDVAVIEKCGSACYIASSLPFLLYLAYKYHNDIEKGLCQNTNLGGENCHRGSALGALLGAIDGNFQAIDRKFIEGLAETEAIRNEIDAFLTQCAL